MRRKAIAEKYTVDGIKYSLVLQESEEVFEITAEIPQQCPRINQFIKDVDILKDHLSLLQDLMENPSKNKEYIEREIRVITEYVSSFNPEFEELRTACETLRKWGNEWKHLARNIFDETSPEIQKEFIPSNIKTKL